MTGWARHPSIRRSSASYLAVGYAPSPSTAFRDVVKLPPSRSWRSISIPARRPRPRTTACARRTSTAGAKADLAGALRERLDGAIQRHLISDVPMGIFLSGGIDSSAIATFAAATARGRCRPSRWDSPSSDRGDEIGYAARVAETLGSPNIRLELNPETLNDLDSIVGSLEEPLSDSAVLPLWHLCRGTGAHVKVALSGEGGDEALGGYGRYYWAGVANSLSHSAIGWPTLVSRLADLVPARTLGPLNLIRRAGKLAHSIDLVARTPVPELVRDLQPRRTARALRAGSHRTIGSVERLFNRANDLALDEVQKLQYVDFHTIASRQSAHEGRQAFDGTQPRGARTTARPAPGRVRARPAAACEGRHAPEQGTVARRSSAPIYRSESRIGRSAASRSRSTPGSAIIRPRGLRHRLVSGALVNVLGLSANEIAKVIDRHVAGDDLGRKLFSLATLELWANRYC